KRTRNSSVAGGPGSTTLVPPKNPNALTVQMLLSRGIENSSAVSAPIIVPPSSLYSVSDVTPNTRPGACRCSSTSPRAPETPHPPAPPKRPPPQPQQPPPPSSALPPPPQHQRNQSHQHPAPRLRRPKLVRHLPAPCNQLPWISNRRLKRVLAGGVGSFPAEVA